jgi:L-2-hydroxyglutarate oxidase LhgO
LANGVQLELLPASKLPNFEPEARTFEGFLWSPTTAISSPADVIQSIRNELVSKKVDFAFGSELKVLDKNTFQIKGEKLFAKHFINAAGSNSDRLAHKFEVGKEFAMVPFLGVYRVGSNSQLKLKRLVYPVPHKINPFLGVHLTLTLDGTIKVGPSAIPILGREQYSIGDIPSAKDILTTSKGLLSIAKGEKHKLSRMIRTEYPNFYLKKIISLASELVPGVANLTDWSRKPPGIRAQLVDLKKGELVQDFVVRSGSNSTHILNTVSPGWTSAIPFAKYIAAEYVMPSLE